MLDMSAEHYETTPEQSNEEVADRQEVPEKQIAVHISDTRHRLGAKRATIFTDENDHSFVNGE